MPNVTDERVCSFHEGQVWISPRGHYWFVRRVVDNGTRKTAELKQGMNGSGRLQRRWFDAIDGWVLHSDPTDT